MNLKPKRKLKIVYKAIGEVHGYESNPRNNDEAIAKVAQSMREFGIQHPIVVSDSGVIICGHTRFEAMKSLGCTQVPVIVDEDLTEAQIKAFRIADNRLGEIADWDLQRLSEELEALTELDFDLDLLGFGVDELDKIMGQEPASGLVDPDAIPEPPDSAETRPGDLWILGDHRLLCGDSAKIADLDTLLGGESIDLVNTDPPYNVNVEPRSGNAIASGVGARSATNHQKFDVARRPKAKQATHRKMRPRDRALVNDFVSEEQFNALLQQWFGNLARVLVPGGSFYIWGGYANCANYPPALRDHDLYFSQAIIWHKQHPVITRKDFMGDHEWCFYGWKAGKAHKFYGPPNATDVWSVKKVNPNAMIHLTEKPVELAVRAIQYSSRKGGKVLDLFGGSGSTLIAAQQTERRAFLMEIDALYCDVIVRRWEEFTGAKARRVTRKKSGRKTTKSET